MDHLPSIKKTSREDEVSSQRQQSARTKRPSLSIEDSSPQGLLCAQVICTKHSDGHWAIELTHIHGEFMLALLGPDATKFSRIPIEQLVPLDLRLQHQELIYSILNDGPKSPHWTTVVTGVTNLKVTLQDHNNQPKRTIVSFSLDNTRPHQDDLRFFTVTLQNVPFEKMLEEITGVFVHDVTALLRSVEATTRAISPDFVRDYTEEEFVQLSESERRAFYQNLQRQIAQVNERKTEIIELADEALKICTVSRRAPLPLSTPDDIDALKEDQNALISVWLRLTALIDNHRPSPSTRAACKVIFIYSAFIGLQIERVKMIALEQLLLVLINNAHAAESRAIQIECLDKIDDETQIEVIITESISDSLSSLHDTHQHRAYSFEHFLIKQNIALQRLERYQTEENKERIELLLDETLRANARFESTKGSATVTSIHYEFPAFQHEFPAFQHQLTTSTRSLQFFTTKSGPSEHLTPEQLTQLNELNSMALSGIIVLADDVVLNLKLLIRNIKNTIAPEWTSPVALSKANPTTWSERGFITEVIANWGIIYAGNGSLAYAAIQQCPNARMMITDHEMPFVTGTELIHLVRALEYVEKRQPMRIALNTGKTANDLGMSQGFLDLLQATFFLKADAPDKMRLFIEQGVESTEPIHTATL